MKKLINRKVFLIMLFLSALITSCAPKQFAVDQLPIGNWSIAMVKAAEGTSIEISDAVIVNNNGWAVITPSNANAIVKLHPTNEKSTTIRLARPGKNDCPSWTSFPGGCEILETNIRGSKK